MELLETVGCRLCSEAEAIVQSVLMRRQYALRPIEIIDDPMLERGYATRIPVLRRTDTGAELDWPFDREEVYRFLF